MVFDDKTITARPTQFGILADDVFSGLPPDRESLLAQKGKSKRFSPGSSIFRSGDKPDFVCILRSGTARVFADSENSEGNPGRVAEANEIFGLTECIANADFAGGLQAVSDCECDVFECSDIVHFLAAEPAVCLRLARVLGTSLLSVDS